MFASGSTNRRQVKALPVSAAEQLVGSGSVFSDKLLVL
jgi:hypothetical protein